jgi:hypothetical protein
MHDEAKIEDIGGAVGMGILATDIVLAIGKLQRSVALTAADTAALRRGRDVLKGLGSPVGKLPLSDGLSHLSSSSTIDALQAVELKFGGDHAPELVDKLADELGAVLQQGEASDYRDALAQISDLFCAIGDAEVKRLANLSHISQDVPPCPTPETLHI